MEIKEKIKRSTNKIWNAICKEEIKEENKKFIIITLILYILIICVACTFHEAWEDETQAWLIARDLSPLGIIKQMRFEGHSCMWHFMLVPFAKLGLPVESMNVISIIAASITGYLVLTKSPFNRLTKVLILFSSVFLYYMPAIVRPYSLMPLIITIISIMNNNRKKYPILYGVILAIMSNIHILMLPFAGILFLENYGKQFWKERKKWTKSERKKIFIGIFIAILGIVFMAIQAILGYFCSVVKEIGVEPNFFRSLHNVLNSIVFYIMGYEYLPIMYFLIISAMICLIIHTIFISKNQGIIFWVVTVSFFGVQIFIWNHIVNQRSAMIFLFLYYYAWNYRYDIINIEFKNRYFKIISKFVTGILVIICILSLKQTFRLIFLESFLQYSPGKEVATYIKEEINENAVFLTRNASYISTVIAYLNNNNYEFYEMHAERNYTFKTWDIVECDFWEKMYSRAIEKHKGKEIYILELIPYRLNLEQYLLGNPEIEENAKLIYKSSDTLGHGVIYMWDVIEDK